jgi:polysaccharide biosynthesis transport protein
MNQYPDQNFTGEPEGPVGFPDGVRWLPSSGGETSIDSLLRLARRYFWLVTICILLGLAYAVYKNARSTPIFRAAASVQLTQDSANQFRLEGGPGGDSSYIDSARLDTEIDILRSNTLAMETIRSLNLDKNKDFAMPPPGRAFDLENPRDRHALTSTFLGGLAAARVGHTNILEITFSSPNPKLAAIICNKLIENYVEHNFKDNYTATEQVSKWLQAQLGELRLRLQASQEHMLSLQNQIGIVGIDQTQSIALARLEGLNADLTKVESERMTKEALVIAMKSSSPTVLDTLSNDVVIMQLRAKRAQLNDEYSALSARYGAANPRMMSLRAEMAGMDEAIRTEEMTIIKRAEKEVEASLRNEANLKAELDAEKQRAYDTNSKVVEYTLARREYESNRTLYDQLEQRLQEAGIIAGLHSTSIRMIDPADTPDYPSSPRKTFNLALGFVAGLLAGVLFAFIIHILDTNIKSVSDVEEKLGLPLLGVIPSVETKDVLPDAFIQRATSGVESGWSQIAESYRSLRTGLLFSRAGSPPKVLLITSSKPAEGKTAVSTLSSITLALSGARVLLIDADLRRPTVHMRFKIPNRVGLSTILTGIAKFPEVVYQHPAVPSLHVLPSGPIAPMPAELLGAPEMGEFIASVRGQYDFIVIDTPPVLTVTDALVLVPFSDGVAIVLRYGEATTKVAVRSRDLLLRSGANLLGAVLNAVDYKSPDYAEYYGRSYKDYYTSRGNE